MRLRLLPLFLATALGAATLLAPPANAVPAGPSLNDVDASVAGVVSGTVSSDQPYVFVSLVSGSGTSARTKVTMADSTAFSLATWGYGAGTSISAWACPTDTYVSTDCSASTSAAFSPKDVVPEVTWFEDSKVGPNDPDPAITVADPAGGGVLVATQETTWGTVFATSVITPGAPDTVDVTNLQDGIIRLSRCSADQTRCTPFNPDQTRPLSVLKSLYLESVDSIAPVSSTSDSSFRLKVLRPYFFDAVPGTGTLTWHLENINAPGVQVGPEHTSAPSATDESGRLAAETLSATGIPDGKYFIAGTLDLEHADFGLFDGVEFASTSFVLDVHAPVLQVTANHPTIYPNVNTTKRPGTVSWSITGTGHQDIGRAEIRSSGGTLITTPSITKGSTKSVIQFNGKTGSGSWAKAVATGYYKVLLWDEVGNPIAKYGVVKVDARRLVTKTWKRTISSAGSVVDQYVGKCSTLRKPAGRGWANSLGYYANTKCSTETSTASLVSTVHAVDVPYASDGYVNLKVSVYGGSATSKPGSRGVVRYLTAAGDWSTERVLPSTLGWHSGYVRAASGMLYKNRNFAWGFYTGFGHRYDVQKFTVVVNYRTLG